jgi:hypothetical protein
MWCEKSMIFTSFILEDFKVIIVPEFIYDNDFITNIIYFWALLFINFHLVSMVDDSGKEIKRFLAIRKTSFWYLITILIACVVNGVPGGFAVQSWFRLALPLSMFIVGFGCLFCSILYAWTIAFSRSSALLTWLEEHPDGQALLDEFRP